MLLLPLRVKLLESGELLSSEALQGDTETGWQPSLLDQAKMVCSQVCMASDITAGTGAESFAYQP